MVLGRTQRFAAICGLVVLAVVLHVGFCRWRDTPSDWSAYRRSPPGRSQTCQPIFAKYGTTGPGLYAAWGISSDRALIFGVILPIALLTLALVLGLHRGKTSRNVPVISPTPSSTTGERGEPPP
jgi:hypothetical protein